MRAGSGRSGVRVSSETPCSEAFLAFMRDKVAPSCGSERVDDLVWWKGKCLVQAKNLVQLFHKMMYRRKPSVLTEINFSFPESPKENFATIFVLDWMVRDSPWAPDGMAQMDWQDDVVGQWFNEGNKESSDDFLDRAENFLQGVHGYAWGPRILGRVIKSNSYVIFFRMGTLASILFREFFNQQDAGEPMQQDVNDPVTCEPSLPPISLVVSSSLRPSAT